MLFREERRYGTENGKCELPSSLMKEFLVETNGPGW